MWSQKRAYEPIRMFQIASCADCDALIDGRSMKRTSQNFGIADPKIVVMNRLTSGFFARSVGFETRLSGCWIRMLLSIAMSHIRNNDTFDNLVVWNII
jgi:hypothetical protein